MTPAGAKLIGYRSRLPDHAACPCDLYPSPCGSPFPCFSSRHSRAMLTARTQNNPSQYLGRAPNSLPHFYFCEFRRNFNSISILDGGSERSRHSSARANFSLAFASKYSRPRLPQCRALLMVRLASDINAAAPSIHNAFVKCPMIISPFTDNFFMYS